MRSPFKPAGAAAPGTTTHTVLGAWGLFIAVLLVMLGNGVLSPLLGIRAEIEGFSTTTIGVVLGFYYVGFLAGASVTPGLVVQVGHIRVYAALASLASTATLIYILTPSPVVWSAARLITGFSMSGLYIVAESWLNDATTNRTRGRLLAVYMLVSMGGLALGQMLITLADPSGIILFIISSILVSVAVDTDNPVHFPGTPPGPLRQVTGPAGLGSRPAGAGGGLRPGGGGGGPAEPGSGVRWPGRDER